MTFLRWWKGTGIDLNTQVLQYAHTVIGYSSGVKFIDRKVFF